MSTTTVHIQRPETILFVGAGATSRLSMPTTGDQAGILWHLCDGELTGKCVEDAASGSKCFDGVGDVITDLLKVVDPGERGADSFNLESKLRDRTFPGVDSEQIRAVVSALRHHYDWSALRLIAKTKKGDGYGEKGDLARENYLQEVFTLIDACLRESRGFYVYGKDDEQIFLSVARLRAARELLVLLINTMFACAWKRLVESSEGQDRLRGYRKFFDSLARLMQQEGAALSNCGIKEDSAEFYKLSYSVITTNFEPMFLWFVWQGHLHANKGADVCVGNPGRMLKLLMNFPTTVGMRKPADAGEDLDGGVWLPCTEAVAQNVNKTSYLGNRTFRLGMYSPVHGMSTFRQCPVCGRLNLYLGDSWDEDSTTLFPNGLIDQLNFGQQPRTDAEKGAWSRGEYDALSCQFCGSLTRSYDNFMFMQTQLKCASPSFIKEMTDEALAQIAGAKHIVLLGYSMPLDDAIWGSLFTTMTRRSRNEHIYCSVVLFSKFAPKKWLYGDDLLKFIEDHDVLVAEKEDVRGLKNAMAVFGKKNVRAYMAGIPDVFGDGTIEAVKRLMYPYDQPGWDIPEFTSNGVKRRGVRV